MKIKETLSFITIQTIMVCLLTFNPMVSQFGSAEANTEIYSSEAKASFDRIRLLQENFSGRGANLGVSQKDKAMFVSEGQEFISSLKGKDKEILNTPEGKHFLKEKNRIARTLAIRQKLLGCIDNTDSKRKLEEQIIGAVDSSTLEIFVGGCDPSLTFDENGLIGGSSLNQFMSTLKETTESINGNKNNDLSNFQDKIHMRSLKNSFSSYLYLRHKYEPDFINQESGEISSAHLESSINDMCNQKDGLILSGANYCSSAQRKELSEFARQKAIEIIHTQEKSNYGDAVGRLSETFKRLNEPLERIKLKTDFKFINEAVIDEDDTESQQAFAEYNDQYMKEIRQPDGLLMLSSALKEKAGGMKKITDDTKRTNSWWSNNHKFKINKHTPDNFSISDLKNAKNEIQGKMIAEAMQLHGIAEGKKKDKAAKDFAVNSNNPRAHNQKPKDLARKRYNDNRKEDIVRLVKSNPTAIGQVLMDNPEFTGMVCDAINEIDNQDKSDQKWDDKFATFGSLFLGGVLVAGTVGAVACTMITFGVCGAAIAAAGATTIAGTSVTVGAAVGTGFMVLGGVEAVHWGRSSQKKNQEYQDMENAIFTGNKDISSIDDLYDKYADYKQARFNFLLSVPAVAFPALGKLAAVSKGTKSASRLAALGTAGKAKTLTGMSNIYKFLGKSEKAKKLFEGMLKAGKITVDQLHDFMMLISTPARYAGSKLNSAKKSVNKRFLTWLEGKLNKAQTSRDLTKLETELQVVINRGLNNIEKTCKI